jgi:hypothetical protein
MSKNDDEHQPSERKADKKSDVKCPEGQGAAYMASNETPIDRTERIIDNATIAAYNSD